MQQEGSSGSEGHIAGDKDDEAPTAPAAVLAPVEGIGQLTGNDPSNAHAISAANQPDMLPAVAVMDVAGRSSGIAPTGSPDSGCGGVSSPSTLRPEIQQRRGLPPVVNWIAPTASASAPSPFASAAAMPWKELEAKSRQVPPDAEPTARSLPAQAAVSKAIQGTASGSQASTSSTAALRDAKLARVQRPQARTSDAEPCAPKASVTKDFAEAAQGAADTTDHPWPLPVSHQPGTQRLQQQSQPQLRQQQEGRAQQGAPTCSCAAPIIRCSATGSSSSSSSSGRADSDSVSSWRSPPRALGSFGPSLDASRRNAAQVICVRTRS